MKKAKRMLKATQKTNFLQTKSYQITADFSAATLKTRKCWNSIFKVMRE